MEKKNLNNCTMNEAIAILKEASMKSERSNFTIKCDNCTLDIVCGGEFNMCDEVIEVALFTVNGETWLPLDMENADGSIFTEDRPIIHNLPLICFPAFVRQFKKYPMKICLQYGMHGIPSHFILNIPKAD